MSSFVSQLKQRRVYRVAIGYGRVLDAWIYLGLGRKSDALKLAQQAADLRTPEKGALVGAFTLSNLGLVGPGE